MLKLKRYEMSKYEQSISSSSLTSEINVMSKVKGMTALYTVYPPAPSTGVDAYMQFNIYIHNVIDLCSPSSCLDIFTA